MPKKSLRQQVADRMIAAQVRQLCLVLAQVSESLEQLAQYLEIEEED